MRGWRRGEAWCRYSKGYLSGFNMRPTCAMHGDTPHSSLEMVLGRHILVPLLGSCVACQICTSLSILEGCTAIQQH